MVLTAINLTAQKNIETTNEFTVEGKVKNRLSFSLKHLADYQTKHLDSIIIYSHLMEPRKTIRNIKGVLLKDIIDKAAIDAESQKLLSEYYITCIASDNYKVVVSWNELYNSIIGESIMIITEADGKKGESTGRQDCIIVSSRQGNGQALCKRVAENNN